MFCGANYNSQGTEWRRQIHPGFLLVTRRGLQSIRSEPNENKSSWSEKWLSSFLSSISNCHGNKDDKTEWNHIRCWNSAITHSLDRDYYENIAPNADVLWKPQMNQWNGHPKYKEVSQTVVASAPGLHVRTVGYLDVWEGLLFQPTESLESIFGKKTCDSSSQPKANICFCYKLRETSVLFANILGKFSKLCYDSYFSQVNASSPQLDWPLLASASGNYLPPSPPPPTLLPASVSSPQLATQHPLVLHR